MDDCYRNLFTVKAVDFDSRRITAVASREIVDRDGEIVSLSALKAAIKGYMANPVILAGHSHRLQDGKSPVVGKVIDHRFEGKDLLITVEFADTPLGLEYWGLYRDKFQRAFSIGFRGIETRDDFVDGKRVRVYTQIELYEISCVAVPANPAALSKDFVARKRLEREKQKIIADVDRWCALIEDKGYDFFYDGKTDGLTEAEVAVLKDHYEKYPPVDTSLDDLDDLCGGFEDDPDDGSEDYAASILDDTGDDFSGDEPEDYGKFFE